MKHFIDYQLNNPLDYLKNIFQKVNDVYRKNAVLPKLVKLKNNDADEPVSVIRNILHLGKKRIIKKGHACFSNFNNVLGSD